MAMTGSMAEKQAATPPPWRDRSAWSLFADVVGGWRQNWDKLVQILAFIRALFRPSVVRRRLERLKELGHIDEVPSLGQLLTAGRDQMMVSAAEETKLFYRSHGIPWVFHNLRRFISDPATMLDPIGLFCSRDTIVHHVLQTFHRHPIYDLVLLRAHQGGIDEIERQAVQILAGTHLYQRALTSLIEDSSYHERLPQDIAAFRADPHVAARPVPPGLVNDPYLMLGMDQFKDIGGFTRYASRLEVSLAKAALGWLGVAFDETLGKVLRVRLGPTRLCLEACDRDLLERYVAAPNEV